MDISLNSDKFLKSFFEYLSKGGISTNTLKFYKSDLSHFTGWMMFKVRSWGIFAETVNEIIPFINNKLAQEYRHFLVQNHVPFKTINRRLSTLRHLARFLLLSQIVNFDFMNGISNISTVTNDSTSIHPLLAEFKKKLEAEKVSENTVKNYVSDIRHFINWLESNKSAVAQN
jgi:site-specific recombinase XerD